MKKLLTLITLSALVYACTPKASPAGSSTVTLSAEAKAGQELYTTKCTRCHVAKNAANYTREQWVPILDNMAAKAKLTADEKANVAAYVNAMAKAS